MLSQESATEHDFGICHLKKYLDRHGGYCLTLQQLEWGFHKRLWLYERYHHLSNGANGAFFLPAAMQEWLPVFKG